MSTAYSANQYESAFKSHKLQNWTIPKHFKEMGSAWPSVQGTWDLPHHFSPVYVKPTARSQEGLDRLRTWGKTKSSTSQALKASENMENKNLSQPAKESQIPESLDGPEIHTEQPRPNSQQNQAKSRPTSQSGQQVQPEELNVQENQAQSRSASQHSHPTRSRPVTQQS
ncbi:Protein Flattop [Triplophysa tibetana]|uniref:Protein Flattop n=1 Tax=Triplophysa tibetana TaxID=1572043 RepID=A0A5A9NCS8_9TELE|nr:Protein Flattop [Triplophysa tibetana]